MFIAWYKNFGFFSFSRSEFLKSRSKGATPLKSASFCLLVWGSTRRWSSPWCCTCKFCVHQTLKTHSTVQPTVSDGPNRLSRWMKVALTMCDFSSGTRHLARSSSPRSGASTGTRTWPARETSSWRRSTRAAPASRAKNLGTSSSINWARWKSRIKLQSLSE